MNRSQRTLRTSASCTGIGLHSGIRSTVTLWPAAPDAGLTFVRSDLSPTVEIPVHGESVVATQHATTLGRGNVRVGTVEHLLSALVGLGIDNLRIAVDGPELPILDGSAAPFVELLRSAGIDVQRKQARAWVVRQPLEVRDGDRYCRAFPATELRLSCTIEFDHPLLRRQEIHLSLNEQTYERELARARTFVLRQEIDALQSIGLARGGSLENAIVVDDLSILNATGLRYADEFVRHKALDLVGDLALCGAPVLGHIVAHKGGHTLHRQLVQALMTSGAAELVDLHAESRAHAAANLDLAVLGQA